MREKRLEGRETLRKATVKIGEIEKRKIKIKEKEIKSLRLAENTENKGKNKNINALVNTLHASYNLETATGYQMTIMPIACFDIDLEKSSVL